MNYLKIARDSEHTVIIGGNGDNRLVEGCIVPRLFSMQGLRVGDKWEGSFVLINGLVPQNVAWLHCFWKCSPTVVSQKTVCDVKEIMSMAIPQDELYRQVQCFVGTDHVSQSENRNQSSVILTKRHSSHSCNQM